MTHRATAVVLGTRPEIIKMAPVIRELKARKVDFFMIHTKQHHSRALNHIVFSQLELPSPSYALGAYSGMHGAQTARMLSGIERVFVRERPNSVLVEGDTNTVLAASLAATKLGIRVGHVEAGLRSFDPSMPEETNRTLVDHMSTWLFAPTIVSEQNLLREGIDRSWISVTGNTIVDIVEQSLSKAGNCRILERLDLVERSYFVATLHRQENVDSERRLRSILTGLEEVVRHTGFPIVLPIHPRTRKRMSEFGFSLSTSKIAMVGPLDFYSFLELERQAKVILTDSGGVQEEACLLRVPCVTLRNNTERPETVQVGANVLAGVEPQSILKKTLTMLERRPNWTNPLGDGHAAPKIVDRFLGRP